jgi:hypothetical protein
MRKPRPAPGLPRSIPSSKDTEQDTDGVRPAHIGPTLLDHLDQLEEGRRRRDDGVTVARAATHTGWRLTVDRVIADLAATGDDFTAEDVRARAGDPLASSPNTLGAAIAAAVRAGVIEQAGYQQARRPEAHARVLRVWRGVMR